MNTIYLERSQVPPQLIGGYVGKQFKFEVRESVYIPIDAGLWSGGSRDTFFAVRLPDGQRVSSYPHHLSPWSPDRKDCEVTLVPGFAVVMHTIFCGKDLGLTFYIHPENAAALLPAPAAELSEHEKIVLETTASKKSSYMGMDRYQMAEEEFRWQHRGEVFMTRAEWESAKTQLIAKGLLNRAGAITPAGRNARLNQHN